MRKQTTLLWMMVWVAMGETIVTTSSGVLKKLAMCLEIANSASKGKVPKTELQVRLCKNGNAIMKSSQ